MTTDMTPDELLRLARVVYPGKAARIIGSLVYLMEDAGSWGERWIPFVPSLDGSERDKSQALDCIVAASDIYADHLHGECFACQIDAPDILSAAIRCILNHQDAQAEAACEKLFTEPRR